MKKLTLIRHAKSSGDDPSLDDFDRPLSKRGERDLPSMAQRVRDFNLVPDQLLTSRAVRALSTAEALIGALGLNDSQVLRSSKLYAASSRSLQHLLQQQDDRWHHLMVVGHNPGLENLCSHLTLERLPKFPTSAVVHIHLKISRWRELADACGTVELFDYPKQHR